jgi:hypothetical protein
MSSIGHTYRPRGRYAYCAICLSVLFRRGKGLNRLMGAINLQRNFRAVLDEVVLRGVSHVPTTPRHPR